MIKETAIFDGKTLWTRFHNDEIEKPYSLTIPTIQREDGVWIFQGPKGFGNDGIEYIGEEGDVITVNYRNV